MRYLQPVIAVALLMCAFAYADNRRALAEPPPDDMPKAECVEHRTEARYRGYGFMHIVHLKNNCNNTQQCKVSTNSNPDVQSVTVGPRQSSEVIAHISSPASQFTAHVKCQAK